MWNSSKCDFDCKQASKTDEYLTLFRMGLFGAGHGSGGVKSPPPSEICHAYPTIMKLGTLISYLKKIQKIYKLRDTSLEFCWH